MVQKENKAHDTPTGADGSPEHTLPGNHAIEAQQLLQALTAMEGYADSLAEKLGPFDNPEATLPVRELTQLREGLKRIAARVGVTTALAERIGVSPEKDPDPPAGEDASKPNVTPEDEMFPMEGFSDATTGLPARSIAEKAIESALGVGRPRYAAVFALDRICHMSSRYGVDVGNQAVRHCAQFLHQKLPSDSLLFRWRGAAFVTLFDISGTMADAKLLMEQIAIQKQKFNFMTNHRSAMVNLTASFQTIALSDHQTPDTVKALVDHFIEVHSARQPH